MSIPVKYYFCVYTTLSSGPTLLESCLLLTGGSLHCLQLGKSYTATFKQVAYFSSIQANSKLAQAICQYIFCKLIQAICQFVFADQLGLSVTIFILDWLGQSVSIFFADQLRLSGHIFIVDWLGNSVTLVIADQL